MLSVVVPVYNTVKYLNKCISSIVNQTYRDFEIILIDDGSNDGSENLCDEWQQKDKRIQVVHKKNAGRILARQDGLSVAQGEYITFVDSDDWLESHFYEDLMKPFLYDDIDISIGGHIFIHMGGEKENKFLYHPAFKMTKFDALKNMLEGKIYGWSMWDKIYRREILSITKDWWVNADLGEDLEFNWKVFNVSNTIMFSPVYGYNYFSRGGSIMRDNIKKDHLLLLDRLDILLSEADLYDDELLGVAIKTSLRQALPLFFSGIYYGIISELNFSYYQNMLQRWERRYKKIDNANSEKISGLSQTINEIRDSFYDKYQKMITEVKIFKQKYSKIYIYGAGKIGQKVAERLILAGIDFEGFIITGNANNVRRSGKKVFSVKEISQEEMECSGFVLALNRHLEKEVVDLLKMKAFTQYICVGKYFMEY